MSTSHPHLLLTIFRGRPLGKGMKMVGRAVTVRFVPQRPDIGADKPAGANSPEYEAFEKCGPKEVIDYAEQYIRTLEKQYTHARKAVPNRTQISVR